MDKRIPMSLATDELTAAQSWRMIVEQRNFRFKDSAVRCLHCDRAYSMFAAPAILALHVELCHPEQYAATLALV